MTNILDERSLSNLFWIALLLSTNAKQAEAAVADSIGSLGPHNLSTDVLLVCVVRLSVQYNSALYDLGEAFNNSLSLLPRELDAVLHLRAKLRHCFVLRILQGLTAEACSTLLQLSADEVGVSVCAGVLELAKSCREEL